MYRETKELPATEIHVSPLHKLAEAIRLGCRICPVQVFHQYGDLRETACAAAAAEAGGYDFYGQHIFRNASCPVCGKIVEGREQCLLIHLNDSHGWSREKIANYVDTLQ